MSAPTDLRPAPTEDADASPVDTAPGTGEPACDPDCERSRRARTLVVAAVGLGIVVVLGFTLLAAIGFFREAARAVTIPASTPAEQVLAADAGFREAIASDEADDVLRDKLCEGTLATPAIKAALDDPAAARRIITAIAANTAASADVAAVRVDGDAATLRTAGSAERVYERQTGAWKLCADPALTVPARRR